MSWNDTFDENTYWQAAEFVNMFNKATWERQIATVGPGTPEWARNYNTDTFSLHGGPVEIGDEIQRAAFWGGIQGMIAGMIGIDNDNGDPYAQIGPWVSPDYDPDGATYKGYNDLGNIVNVFQGPFNASLSWGQIRDSLGYPAALYSWRRKKPREVFVSGTPTHDSDNNPLADGMVAWDLNAGNGPSRTRLVKRIGGVWTEVSWADESPDTLDSWAEEPNRCEPFECLPGDYIGHWIFNEIRDMLNMMTKIYVVNGVGVINDLVYTTEYNPDTEAYEYVQDVGAQASLYAYSANYGGDHTDWSRGSGDVTAGVMVRELGRTIDYYNVCDWEFTFPGNEGFQEEYFNANGDPVANNAVTKWLSKDYGVNDPPPGNDIFTVGEPWPGDASVQPASAPHHGDAITSTGYGVAELFNLITYHFEFGPV